MNGTALYRALVHAGAPEDEAKEATDSIVLSDSINNKITAIDNKIDKQFEAIDRKFEAIDKNFEAIDRKFEAIDKKFEAIDKKFEAIDRKFEVIGERLNKMDIAIAELRVTNRILIVLVIAVLVKSFF